MMGIVHVRMRELLLMPERYSRSHRLHSLSLLGAPGYTSFDCECVNSMQCIANAHACLFINTTVVKDMHRDGTPRV